MIKRSSKIYFMGTLTSLTSKNKHLRYASFALVAAGVFVAGACLITQRVDAAADDREIKEIVMIAFNPSVSFGKIEHISGTVKSGPSSSLSDKLADNDVETARKNAKSTLARISHPDCVVCAMSAQGVDDGLTGEAKGFFRIVDSGTKDVEWQQVTIGENTAAVTVSATSWIKTISRDEFGNVNESAPVDGAVKIFNLTKMNGHWVITNIVTDQIATDNLEINKKQPSEAQKAKSIPNKPLVSPQGGAKSTN